MTPWRWLILALVVAWVFLGPIGLAFGSCAAMMTMCDGVPCGIVSAMIDAAPRVAPPTVLSTALPSRPVHLATVLHSALEPPPKLVALSV